MSLPDKFVVSFNSSYLFFQTSVRFESVGIICRSQRGVDWVTLLKADRLGICSATQLSEYF